MTLRQIFTYSTILVTLQFVACSTDNNDPAAALDAGVARGGSTAAGGKASDGGASNTNAGASGTTTEHHDAGAADAGD